LIFCGALNFPNLNTNCPPICTIPQGSYQEIYLDINNPATTQVQLQITSQVGLAVAQAAVAASPVASDPASIDLTCTNSVCGPFSLDLTPGNWTLAFTPSIVGASVQSLTFTLQVIPSIPTPEFPIGSLLTLVVPMLAFFAYVSRPGGRAVRDLELHRNSA
jgi:hypothetical protein